MRVTLERLTKHFGKVVAVDDLNLEIQDGEFVALLGPSGCGKTTVLLTVAGIYKPTSGLIRFNGRVVNDLPPKDRNIGMVFQSYALYPHMTAYENIAFPLSLQGIPLVEMRRRAQQVASLLQIEELLDRRPGQISGGQQQRVALARALVKEPDLLLLDEPLSNLDAKLRLMARTEIKRLQKELGITTIFVTHDQVEAMTMADRIAILHQGRLQQFSSPEELYYRPLNLFVAGFIGMPPMNFLPVVLRQTMDRYELQGEGFALEIPEWIGAVVTKHARDREMILGIRPEDITITQDRTGLEAQVYMTEPLGKDLLVDLHLGSQDLRVLTASTLKVAIGDKIWLRFEAEKIHLFDQVTGSSLLNIYQTGEER